MTRNQFIEMALRQIYGSQPTDDSSITFNLVNLWLGQATAIAAKANYVDAIKLDGIGYVNNSFYTTYKGIAVTPDEQLTWKVSLPQIPVGIGRNEGINTLQFKNENGTLSYPCIPISANQKTYYQTMRKIPNKTLFYYEGNSIFALSTILLNQYTATVSMISGGDSTDLNSELNVPPDYYPNMVQYIKEQLMAERLMPQDLQNDGTDLIVKQ